jgi:ferric-dicitrate binding protein FerR (iron transport regulator)
MNRPEQRYHSSEAAARALGQLLRGTAPTTSEAPAEPDRERERLLRALSMVDSRAATRPRSNRWLLLVAAMLLAVAGLEWQRRSAAPLTFSVDGAPRADGATIAAGPEHEKRVRFSDGSTFEVEPGAHLRVEASSPRGSRLALVDGEAKVHVVHREQAAWAVNAGPFEIHVIGTRFDVGWDPMRRRLSVQLYEGAVQVVGGPLSAPVRVHAGQRLDAGAGSDDWQLTSSKGPGGEPASAPAPGLAPSAPEPAVSENATSDVPERSAAPAVSIGASGAASDWSALVERADFDGIVREANLLGIDHCLAVCAPRDVRILADAARYSGRTALAERSLLALRKRAPAEAATAAFLLARLHEQQGQPEAALSWYESYLKEAQSSVYTAEALAGKMRMLLLTGGGAEARSTAADYLKRFPNGVAAATARKILTNVHNP